MNDNHAFCRTLLSVVMKEVRLKIPAEVIKLAWAHGFKGGSGEFHISECALFPRGIYGHGQTCCKYYTKVKGWEEVLRMIEDQTNTEYVNFKLILRLPDTKQITADT